MTEPAEQNKSAGPGLPVEVLVGLAVGWKLRAITLEQCGVMVASKCLRECAEELEAAMQDRRPMRTSWYAHEEERATETESDSRGMFVARLENMQESGDQRLTVAAVLALLSDCDMLAQKPNAELTGGFAAKEKQDGK